MARGVGRGETVALAWVGFLCSVLQVGGEGQRTYRQLLPELRVGDPGSCQGPSRYSSDTFQGCRLRECVTEQEGKESKQPHPAQNSPGLLNHPSPQGR